MSIVETPATQTSLYKFISALTDGPELTSAKIKQALEENNLDSTLKKRLECWLEELSFWEEYARIYRNLEKAGPYRGLSKTFENLIAPRPNEVWLDIGCGPAKISRLLWQKSNKTIKKIVGMDIVLNPAQETLSAMNEKMPLELTYGNIGEKFPFPNNSFDGIVANLVLPYVIDYEGKTGREALIAVLKEVYRVLKPNGQLVWSTPKHNVKFQWVFLASLPDMLNFYHYIAEKDFTRILQGTRILKHALSIQKKGKVGKYTFLPLKELEELLQKIGFISIDWQRTFAQQVFVCSAYKKPVPNP